MNKFTILEFVRAIFDEEETAQQAAEIGQAILAVRSLRMTDILLRQNWTLSLDQHNLIYQTVLPSFTSLVHCPVQT